MKMKWNWFHHLVCLATKIVSTSYAFLQLKPQNNKKAEVAAVIAAKRWTAVANKRERIPCWHIQLIVSIFSR